MRPFPADRPRLAGLRACRLRRGGGGDFLLISVSYRSNDVNDRSSSTGSNTFLATTPAPSGLKRCALAIIGALSVVFCALIPFARIPLSRSEAFIPIFETGLAL